MAKKKLSQNESLAALEKEFKHHTSIGADGEILYDCPIEIKDQADLDNYGISWEDCTPLSFGESQRITVYMYRTTNRELADYQWAYLDTQHSRGYASVRCMISGQRKDWIRCPDTRSCANCPNREHKRSPIISLDSMVEDGYEPSYIVDWADQICGKMDREAIIRRMNAEDPRIAQIVMLRTTAGYSVKEIAAKFSISMPRVYQILKRAVEIGEEYRAEHGE